VPRSRDVSAQAHSCVYQQVPTFSPINGANKSNIEPKDENLSQGIQGIAAQRFDLSALEKAFSLRLSELTIDQDNQDGDGEGNSDGG